MSAGLCTDAH